MIRVEREEKGRYGKFRYHVPAYGVGGVSRQPLCDACRRLSALGVNPTKEVGLFRGKSTIWDLRTTVGYGATKTVVERDRGGLTLETFNKLPTGVTS